jgi:anthraniloyl-CoA monooxygenase
MKIVCIGAGPAGLYFAIAAKLRDPSRDITVLERDPRGATYGWGVVYWDDLLDLLFVTDPVSARAVRQASALWKDQEIHVRGQVAHLGGYGFATQRAAFLGSLARRAEQLGVRVEYGHPVEDLAEVADADLIVAADGAGSRIRQLHGDAFGTRVDSGYNPYIWLGTDRVFDSFVFAFEETASGWVWFHAYPSSDTVSTCIVECTEETWRGLGMDWRDEADGIQLLQKIFEQPLQGHSLISQARGEPARWLRFKGVANETLCHGNTVLLGDAGHTTHFTIGSGTRLAIIDTVELVRSLDEFPDDVTAALQDFDERARPNLRRIQATARSSMNWYEHADDYLNDRNAVDAAFAMATRGSSPRAARYRRFRREQLPPVRSAEAVRDTARRYYLAARRGEFPLVPSWHPGPPPGRPPADADAATLRKPPPRSRRARRRRL